jgi:hypothetical protein
MDQGLFIFAIFCIFFWCAQSSAARRTKLIPSFLAIGYCFLSTCLGVQIRRSDIIEAFTPPTIASVQKRDREQRERLARRTEGAGEYELDDMAYNGPGYGRIGNMGGGAMGGEELEMMRGRRGMI